MISSEIKSGFVGVLGQTNVGKSSLINAILGKKLLIVSDKRQSTRNRVRCIYNDDDSQIVFVDTPGLHRPVDRLSKYLLKQAMASIDGLDLLLYMIEPWVKISAYDRRVFEGLGESNLKKFLLINKVDQARGNALPETILNYSSANIFDEIIPVSCTEQHNLDRLMEVIKAHLPSGPRYFPEDTDLDRPESFIIAEFIREKIFQLTREEIPYSVYVEVVDIAERKKKNLLDIYANIHVARNSQKGILVGDKGSMIREIGMLARADIENLLGIRVYLDLRVRVTSNWNENEPQIAEALGGQE